MQNYFKKFSDKIVGNELLYGEKVLIFADWNASGRLYHPIEERLLNTFGPFVGNTHTETSETGTLMTKSYHLSLCVNAFCRIKTKVLMMAIFICIALVLFKILESMAMP